jgi:hypothetical protein
MDGGRKPRYIYVQTPYIIYIYIQTPRTKKQTRQASKTSEQTSKQASEQKRKKRARNCVVCTYIPEGNRGRNATAARRCHAPPAGMHEKNEWMGGGWVVVFTSRRWGGGWCLDQVTYLLYMVERAAASCVGRRVAPDYDGTINPPTRPYFHPSTPPPCNTPTKKNLNNERTSSFKSLTHNKDTHNLTNKLTNSPRFLSPCPPTHPPTKPTDVPTDPSTHIHDTRTSTT